VAGIVVGMLLLVSRHAITSYLNLPDSMLIVLLAIGMAFYVPLGARRGYLQGVCNFRHLAYNLVLEGLVRLCGSLVAIMIGAGVRGVIGANVAAVALAYFFSQPKLRALTNSEPQVPVAFREGLQAAVFFCGAGSHQQLRHRGRQTFLPIRVGGYLRGSCHGREGGVCFLVGCGQQHVSDRRRDQQAQ